MKRLTGDDLFVLPASALAAAELRARHKRRGHAGQPGQGPATERCGTCKWVEGVSYARTFFKCSHRMAPRHTKGPATDIRKKDPACERWEAVDASA